MLNILKTWFCWCWMPIYFGGDSSSQANQTQTTETQDNRIAAATDSTNINASRATAGGNLTINATDNGAVKNALDFATQISHGAADLQAASLGAVQAAASHALDSVQSAYADNSATISKAYQNVSATLADAYTTAKAGEQKVLVAGVVGVLVLALVKIFGKGS